MVRHIYNGSRSFLPETSGDPRSDGRAIRHRHRALPKANILQLSATEVKKAAQTSMARSAPPSASLAHLRLKNMKLHGREGDVDLLQARLRRLAAREEGDGGGGASTLPEVILVAGVSGTGKSALVARGLREPTLKMGMAFGGGKFDQNDTTLPLSAFSEAMTSLAKQVLTSEHRERTVNDIQGEFGADDLTLLSDALPKCGELLGRQYSRGSTPKMERAGSNMWRTGGPRISISKKVEGANLGGQTKDLGQTGKELITRQQFAIGRLLKIICTNLGGVVLFIDDLQVREGCHENGPRCPWWLTNFPPFALIFCPSFGA